MTYYKSLSADGRSCNGGPCFASEYEALAGWRLTMLTEAERDYIDVLRAENERLRDALVIVDEQESRPDFAQWLSVRSVVRHALATLEGRD